MIFQYDWELALIQRSLISFEAMLEYSVIIKTRASIIEVLTCLFQGRKSRSVQRAEFVHRSLPQSRDDPTVLFDSPSSYLILLFPWQTSCQQQRQRQRQQQLPSTNKLAEWESARPEIAGNIYPCRVPKHLRKELNWRGATIKAILRAHLNRKNPREV